MADPGAVATDVPPGEPPADDAAAAVDPTDAEGDDFELDIEDLMDVMEEEDPNAPPAAVATAAATTTAAEEEEEEEEESGTVPPSATLAPMTSPSLAADGATSLPPGAAAPPAKEKPKKKRPSTAAAKADDESRSKMQRLHAPPASPSQHTLAADSSTAVAPAAEAPPAFPLTALRRLVHQLLAPIPAARLPPALAPTLGELGKLMIEDIIAEAMRIRDATAKHEAESGTAAPTASHGPLTPSLIREAHRRLVNAGAIPTRTANGATVAPPPPVVTSALDEDDAEAVQQPAAASANLAGHGGVRIQRKLAWRR